MKQRIVTGAIFASIMIAVLAMGGWFFHIAMLIAAIIGIKELIIIARKKKNVTIMVFSYVYILAGFYFIDQLRQEHGFNFAFWVILTIWMTDSGAYFVGKTFGKHKIAPKVSPKKSWEGLIGGAICAIIVSIAAQVGLQVTSSIIAAAALGVLISVVGQTGDLLESAVKRYYGVKDSGSILPGHGGILDRFDSLFLVAILLGVLF